MKSARPVRADPRDDVVESTGSIKSVIKSEAPTPDSDTKLPAAFETVNTAETPIGPVAVTVAAPEDDEVPSVW